jgi:hypothetical protein
MRTLKEVVTTFLKDVRGIEKSIVSRSCSANYFTIQDGNVLTLGEYLPPDTIDEIVPTNGKLLLLVARGEYYYDTTLTVEDLDKDITSAEAQNKAIELVEANQNNVRCVLVCRGVNKTFATRPVFQAFAQYTYVSKEEKDVLGDEFVVDVIKVYDTVDNLPAAVKKLSVKKQRQFMHVWNSAYSKSKNETTAFKEAWGVVNKNDVGMDNADSKMDKSADTSSTDMCSKCNHAPCICGKGDKASEDTDLEKSKESAEVAHFIEIKKGNFVNGLVYGVVYEPLRKDTHGDWTSAEEIEKWANDFLPSALRDGTWSNVQHRDPLTKHDVEIAQSYIAPCDFVFPNGENIVKGSWVVVSKVNNEELKKSIESGEITGYSLEGTGRRLNIDLQ